MSLSNDLDRSRSRERTSGSKENNGINSNIDKKSCEKPANFMFSKYLKKTKRKTGFR